MSFAVQVSSAKSWLILMVDQWWWQTGLLEQSHTTSVSLATTCTDKQHECAMLTDSGSQLLHSARVSLPVLLSKLDNVLHNVSFSSCSCWLWKTQAPSLRFGDAEEDHLQQCRCVQVWRGIQTSWTTQENLSGEWKMGRICSNLQRYVYLAITYTLV